MADLLASLAMPAVTVAVGLMMLLGKRDYFQSFTEGAREGLETAVRPLPTLTALTPQERSPFSALSRAASW